MGKKATQFTSVDRKEQNRKADTFSTLVESLSDVGAHVKMLKDRCQTQRDELETLRSQNSILRADRTRFERQLGAALRAKDAPVALETDEEWLLFRNTTLKFGLSADGRRILVMRCRGQRIVRLRDKVLGEGQTTDLLKQALKIGRQRANGRSYVPSRSERARIKKRAEDHFAKNVEKVRLREEQRERQRQGQEESPNETLARRQDRLAGPLTH